MPKETQTYNFKRPDRVSKHQIRSLHFVHDKFARNCSSAVSAFLRTVVDVNLVGIDQVPYSEFLNGVPDPTCFMGLTFKPVDGVAVLEVGPEVVYPMLDRMLGGQGKPLAVNRPMTEIEQEVVRQGLRIFIDNLQEAWRPVFGLEFTMGAIESHPHMLQVVGGNEMVIQFKFSIRIRDSVGKAHLGIPTLMVEPILHLFDQEMHARRKVIHDTGLMMHIHQVPVQVSIETEEVLLPMTSLMSLSEGDTLVLDHRTQLPFVIKVGNQRKLMAAARPDTVKRTFNIVQGVN